ncbi:MAG: S8 family serine peptidase [Candidatus Binatia bacterium]|nr:S8 family serine peptidase [Candidatus Binatia bacterium]
MAPAAGIIGLRVLEGAFPPAECQPSDEPLTRVLNALDWILDHGAALGVAAVNMSFMLVPTDGSPALHSEPCAGFADLSRRIVDLWRLGILPVAASGSSGLAGVTIPACIPGVVSVGAVYDAVLTGQENSACPGDPSAPDRVWCRSSTFPFLTVLAPGARILWDAFVNAGVGAPGGGSGTSAAAPHVSGAIAALRGQGGVEDDRPECTLARIVRTGVRVVDHRTGQSVPRLDLAAAAGTRPNFIGDCNHDRIVTSAELTRSARILLGILALSHWPPLDADGDGIPTIDELISAVNFRLYRCPLPPVVAI